MVEPLLALELTYLKVNMVYRFIMLARGRGTVMGERPYYRSEGGRPLYRVGSGKEGVKMVVREGGGV